MFAKERHDKILKLLSADGAVTTAGLTAAFNVSCETVRRDLLELEERGALQRVHGGAIQVSEMKVFEDLTHRKADNKESKAELCKTAVRLVNEGDIIAVDTGSTAVYFAQAIKARLSSLTVITHSVDVFEILAAHEGFEVILCGGSYDKKEKAFYGQLAGDTLKRLYVNKAFIFPSAISLKSGICDFHKDLMQMQLLMLESCDKAYFLADSDKFEKNALLKLCDLSERYTYVTDSKLNLSLKQIYSERGFNVISSEKEV